MESKTVLQSGTSESRAGRGEYGHAQIDLHIDTSQRHHLTHSVDYESHMLFFTSCVWHKKLFECLQIMSSISLFPMPADSLTVRQCHFCFLFGRP
jgi:hypothetical protein